MREKERKKSRTKEEKKRNEETNRNKTGMDRFQDCCKAKATNALLQS